MYKVTSVRPNILEATLNEQLENGFKLHTALLQPTGVYTLILEKVGLPYIQPLSFEDSANEPIIKRRGRKPIEDDATNHELVRGTTS